MKRATRPFGAAVTNHSTDAGGIPAGAGARNLALVVLGREAETPADVTLVLEKVRDTIANGLIGNLGYDYFFLPVSPACPFVVSQTGSYGTLNLTTNADLGSNEKHMGFRIVSRNGYKGKNGVSYDHVVFHALNIPGSGNNANAMGCEMNTTNTNNGGFLSSLIYTQYLDKLAAAYQAQGIPLDQAYIKAVPRRVSKGGTATDPGYDLIDGKKLLIPTEYEMFGSHSSSNDKAENAANQGRWEWYDSNSKRIKYNKDSIPQYYKEASPRTGSATLFCAVLNSGLPSSYTATSIGGIAVGFCVAGA